jgi:HPt (histidine-containing phosphotransfer) domain-containing protein
VEKDKISIRAPEGIPPRMVTEYLNRCVAALPIALEALDRSDYGHMRIFGHRLKGSGGAYGIPALTEIGSAIEAAARQDDTSELRLQVAALKACLSQIEILSD